MQLNISGHHLDITDAIHNYVTNKLTKLEHHNDKITIRFVSKNLYSQVFARDRFVLP